MGDTTTAAPAQPAVTASPPPTIDAAEARRQAELTAATAHRQELVKLNQQAIDGYTAQGRQAGVIEGRKAEMDRAAAIYAACPGKPDLAISAILGGQSAESVKLAFDQTVAAEARAREVAEAKDAEIARWQALAATGGYPGGIGAAMVSETDDGESAPPDWASAKAQATNEWDRQPARRKGFTSKQNYVNARAAELMGKFHVQVATQQA